MKEIKTNLLVLSLIGLIAFGAGLPIGIFAFNKNEEDESVPAINITSLENGEIVHSVVIIDAATITLDSVEVLVNDVVIANYLPYEWNNMLEPVGTYNVTVRGYLGAQVFQSTKIIEIPETFVVPIDYDFTQDFVVHTGQTVTFANGNWGIQSNSYTNGVTPINEKTPLHVNVFGDLIIDNSSITARTMVCDNSGSITLINNSHIETYERYPMILYNETSGEAAIWGDTYSVRFDDDTVFYYDDSLNIEEIFYQYDDAFIIFDEMPDLRFLFNENSSWELI
ncbi:MAG: hypothetical protein ACTSWC_04525, partial [Promethearchaeota archaeon]